jgi:hypothetical protein
MLDRVLVEAQQMSDGAVPEGRMIFNELFDRLCELRAAVERPASSSSGGSTPSCEARGSSDTAC